MILWADTVMPTIDQFINYGSFGLVAFLVMAFVFKIYPDMRKTEREEREAREKAAEEERGRTEKAAQSEREKMGLAFTATVTKLVDQFHIESLQCKLDREESRSERIQSAKEGATEREKDRELRHELKNMFNLIQLKFDKENRREGKS